MLYCRKILWFCIFLSMDVLYISERKIAKIHCNVALQVFTKQFYAL